MALSEMTSKERTIVIVLGIVIIVALVGIGVLVAKLVTGDGGDGEGPIAVPEATEAPVPLTTVTLVANPVLRDLDKEVPESVGEQPVVVTQVKSSAPLLPAMLLDQPLRAGHRYRLEITAVDGSTIDIRGSWSQAAQGDVGELELPLPESFEGKTPFVVDVEPPMSNPNSWSISASASPKGILGDPPIVVITIWDVTGVE